MDELSGSREKLVCVGCGVNGSNSINQQVEADIIVESSYADLNSFMATRGLKLFHQNVNGLRSKLSHIDLMIKETRSRIDILGITETHLNDEIVDEELNIDGYTFIRNDRNIGSGEPGRTAPNEVSYWLGLINSNNNTYPEHKEESKENYA